MFLAMMWWYPNGAPTIGFWYAALVASLLIAGGIWGLIAPESFRTFYFRLLRNIRTIRSDRAHVPSTGWGWGSPTSIRLSSVLAIALAAGFMSWVLFFTVPGRVY
ncbi:MAG: hypothetical protein E6I73_00075 [Chloroflexi bacterium]|nr:MAG: hypothetical protein E6I73_00075 [Chloroflexota bacterium]